VISGRLWVRGLLLVFVVLLAIAAAGGCTRSVLSEKEQAAHAYKSAAPGTAEKPALSVDEPEPGAAELPAGRLWMVGNDQEVKSGGSPTKVTLASRVRMTEIWTYHWNAGAGAPGGQITLTAADGKVYGPWQATASNKVYWVAKTDIELPAGEYTVTDSDPGTWAQNAGTSGQGHTWAQGTVLK
jgi:hypothetical protein